MVATWLVAWLLGIAGLAVLAAGWWSIATYRRLARDGAPGPGRVLWKLWATPIARVLRLGGRGQPADLAGRRAWVWWDVRWGPSGQSEAVVRGADGRELRLSLLAPAEMYSQPAGRLVGVTEVRFTAARPPDYTLATVTGILEPADQSSHEHHVRARVCVL